MVLGQRTSGISGFEKSLSNRKRGGGEEGGKRNNYQGIGSMKSGAGEKGGQWV